MERIVDRNFVDLTIGGLFYFAIIRDDVLSIQVRQDHDTTPSDKKVKFIAQQQTLFFSHLRL